MLFHYGGDIKRYLTQIIRVLSNFTVQYSDGSLIRVPVLYGDPDRQASHIINQNSENTTLSLPKIAVYISGLSIDRERTMDSTHVSNVFVRERGVEIDPTTGREIYTQTPGRSYVVERLMPSPYKLTVKADLLTSNTDQKMQLIEQICVLFNPALELQTSSNFVDWTSLSVLYLNDVAWSNRSVPIGPESKIDIATLTFETPIWISPPVKVKYQGIITKIISSLYTSGGESYWSNLDSVPNAISTGMGELLTREIVTITDYNIQVYSGQAWLLQPHFNTTPKEPTLEIPDPPTTPISWMSVFSAYTDVYKAGISKLFLIQSRGIEMCGHISISDSDPTILLINWDPDTYPSDDDITTNGDREASGRNPGTFDAIIDPTKVYPGHGMESVESGDRFLIIEDIGSINNTNGPRGWKNNDNSDFIGKANDIIEWDRDHWIVIFEAEKSTDMIIYQTNIYGGKRVQYMWNGISWNKSFDGFYSKGNWRIEL